MPVVYLIRHGESESNAGASTYNSAKVRLTLKGKAQADCICEFFIRSPSLVVTSPYLRAKETAIPTLNRFPEIKSEVWDVQEFTYLSYLKMQSMTIEQRRPRVNEYWSLCDPNYLDGEECESFVDLINRAKSTISRIRLSSHKSIALFTHGQFIKAFLWLQFSQSSNIQMEQMKQFFAFLNSFAIDNGSIIKIYLCRNGSTWIGNVITNHLINQNTVE